VAHRSVEVLIGRLITDEALRDAFLANRVLALQAFVDAGHELTPVEVSAIHATPATLWRVVATRSIRGCREPSFPATPCDAMRLHAVSSDGRQGPGEKEDDQ